MRGRCDLGIGRDVTAHTTNRLLCLHLLSSVSSASAFFPGLAALAQRLEERDRAGDGGVEGFGAADHGDVGAEAGVAAQLLRDAAALGSDDERRRALQVHLVERLAALS